MNTEHHNKIIIISVLLVVIVVVILGVVVVFGKKDRAVPTPANPAETEYDRLIEATTASGGDYSMSDPEVQALIKATSGSGSSGAGASSGSDREALIRATTGN